MTNLIVDSLHHRNATTNDEQTDSYVSTGEYWQDVDINIGTEKVDTIVEQLLSRYTNIIDLSSVSNLSVFAIRQLYNDTRN